MGPEATGTRRKAVKLFWFYRLGSLMGGTYAN
jgi:hypothetical protein